MRVETVLQAQATECGVAALAMLLTHFDRYVPLEELRRVTGVSRDGSNAKIMIAAARHYGVELKPVLVEPHELVGRGLPVIVHLNFGHFVVVEGMDDHWVQINDPSGGRCKLSVEEFDLKFTGVAFVGKVMPQSESVGKPTSLIKLIKASVASFKWYLVVCVLLGFIKSMVVVFGVGFLQKWIDAKLAHQMMLSSGVFLFLLVMCGWVAWRFEMGFERVEKKVMWGETQRLLRHIVRLPHSFFSYRLPSVLHGVVFGCGGLSKQLSGIVKRVMGVVGGLILVVAMFFYYPPLAGLVLMFFGVQMGVVFWMRQRAELFLTETSSYQSGSGYAASMVERVEALKTGGMDVEFMAQVSGNDAYGVSQKQRRSKWDVYERVVEVGMQTLVLLGVLIWGAVLWASDDLAVGAVVALLLLSAWALDGVRGVGVLMGDVRALRASILSVDDVHAETVEDVGGTGACLEGADRPKAVGVVLNDVTFGYSHARPARLHTVHLNIPSGQVLGVSGPSGGGKSTIAGVIAGLHRPWSGSVEVGGHDLLDLSSNELARTVALVDKTIFLFDGTVRDNLRLWDDSVSDETLWDAVRDVGLAEVLEQRGEGLDCRVMERGLNFSGGQRQRLEIARALTRNPALLILDEANDALEVALEQQIMANLRRRGLTVVIITHREETLRQCDDLVRVENGHIVSSLTLSETSVEVGDEVDAREDGGVVVSALDVQNKMDGDATPLLNVFACVADEMGVDVGDQKGLNTSGVMAIYELARRCNLLVRRVVLTERVWWQKDCGALIAFWGAHKQPVALLPVVGGGYHMYDPETKIKQKVTQEVALGLDEKVFMLYGRLPDGPKKPKDLLRFSFSKLRLDVASVVLTGVAAMALALVWPLLGQRLFTSGVSWIQTIVTLFFAGFSGGLLLFVSHLAQARLFARVNHRAITVFWDRIVRLPVDFIRQDRAESLGQVENGLKELLIQVQTVVREGWFALPALTFAFVLCGLGIKLAVCVLGVLLLGVLVALFLTMRICKLEPKRFDVAVQTSTFLFDLLRGLRRLRAANSRLKTIERWETMMQDRLGVEGRIARLTHMQSVVLDLLPLLGVGGFVAGMTYDFDAVGTAGRMIGASVCVLGLVSTMRSLSVMLCAVMLQKPQEKRLKPVLAEPTEAFAFAQREGLALTDVRCDNVLAGAIAVYNMTFRYTEHAEPALLDVSLDVPPGKVTVISGPSGCGKSTLLRVLLGYLTPQQGEVLYDGVRLGGWHLDVLRGQIGAVLQEDALWDGILRNNISGMAPFSMEEVWASLRLVDLDRDVDKMPRNVNTFAGEATLSTGQKQRLVMARQLIRKPRLLILDEATSALDEETEARVFANLRSLNITCICVAHRESTLAHADRIYRMRDGKIVL